MKNLIIDGENIKGLHYLLNEKNLKGKIDLVYIDPPFATNDNFTITEGRASTISNSRKGQVAYSDKLTGTKFIAFLRERLLLLQTLLSEQGSIYLHTDYKIGHYIKVMMDEIFGINNFRNDITRIKCNPKNFRRTGYGNIKDMILFYSKSSKPIWHEPNQTYTQKDIETLFPKIRNGRRYTTVPIHAPGTTENGKSNQPFRGMLPPTGRHWRTDVETLERWDNEQLIEWSANGNPRKILFADEKEGKRMQDIWEFKDPQYPTYPTEKNSALLELIIKTSSNTDSIVLDCFCGSGTTLKSAHLLNRSWIGIDRSEHAIKATVENMQSVAGHVSTPVSTPAPEYEFIKLEHKETAGKPFPTETLSAPLGISR
ncbi:site-specific DNA-methyltransferase [Candidatus Haliotispira prima]|uniref:site-specific DNA-methyltransferase (adenine-specific) n=1 Tax=Candidatus Haliotispira prima TaxID=3034016 RepID=A0ABY8MJY1_9SPIO|nr:site-specific DNA-methyltransferase [Candidatus Haliotispira prima]